MSKLYFAMINGERRGPFNLDELHNAGVMPDTYVWCKTMSDWEKAEDVADICRYYRQRLFNLMHPTPTVAEVATEPNTESPEATQFTRYGIELPPVDSIQEDYSVEPPSLVILAIIVTIFFFPLAGVGIYYAVLSRRAWHDSQRAENEDRNLYSIQERKECQIRAHEYARKAKMWIGISFFIGIIIFAVFINLI